MVGGVPKKGLRCLSQSMFFSEYSEYECYLSASATPSLLTDKDSYQINNYFCDSLKPQLDNGGQLMDVVVEVVADL